MNFRRKILLGMAASSLSILMQKVLAAGSNPVPLGLHRIKGDVRINGSEAREGTLVKAGDTIQTGPGAEAIYVIGQDAFLQRENSKVSFGNNGVEFLRVITGKLLSVFGKGAKRIETPTATIGIRGTGCYIEAEANRVYFCLCYGEAELTPTVAPQEKEIIVTKHHDHPLYISNDPNLVKSPVPPTVVNHYDAELTLLENLVGRRPPFDVSSGHY
jgi:hypothetical protein